MIKWASGQVGCLMVICSCRMGSCLVRSRRVISLGCELRDLILTGCCGGRERCRDQCNWKGQGCVSAWLSPWLIPSHLPRNLPTPVLQGSRIAGTKRGKSPAEILSFCLKRKQQKNPHIAALLLPLFIAAFVFWIDYL